MSVWASHADEVLRIPDGFTRLAHSSICNHEAIAHLDKQIYGLQWHPEVSHTFEGKRVFENFNRITRENLFLNGKKRLNDPLFCTEYPTGDFDMKMGS